MTSYELIQRLRRQGGDVRLGPEGQLQTKNCPKNLKRAISRSKPRLTAWLRELRASKEWEASGRNPDWWRHSEGTWNYAEQSLKPFSEIVRIWLAEHCVGAVRCASNPRILYREFSVWAGFERDAAEHEFLQQLGAWGFSLHDGMVPGICLAGDFMAALEYENERSVSMNRIVASR